MVQDLDGTSGRDAATRIARRFALGALLLTIAVAITSAYACARCPGVPRLAFWVVDVRDLALLHVRAMTEPRAAGERFLGTGELMWMIDIATTLHTLGAAGARVPTRVLPDFLVRTLSLISPQLRALAPELGRRNDITSEKARRVLGFAPRPGAETILDTAHYLLAG